MLSQWVEKPILNLYELKLLVDENAIFLKECIISKQCPAAYRWFIKELSRASPVSALIPVDAIDAVQQVLDLQLNGETIPPTLVRLVSEKTPFVYRLLSEGSIEEEWVRESLQACLQTLKPLLNAIPHEYSSGGDSLPFSYLPNLKRFRDRGVYTSDKQKGETVCNKYHQHHKALLPGVFTIHCQHGMYRCIRGVPF